MAARPHAARTAHAARSCGPDAWLAPVLAALADARSDGQPLPADRLPIAVHTALSASGLWKLWVPESLGGLEQDLPASLALFEQAAAADGSLGFALAIGTGGGLFAAWLPEPVARELFTPQAALIAGSGAPTGTARRVEGGVVVDGEWRYASLVHSATWITASVMLADSSEVVAVAVPVAEVEILDRWRADALAGTDSHDIRMRGVYVPAARVFDLAQPPRERGPLYRFDFMALAAAAFASVAVGIARGAVELAHARLAARPSVDGDVAARLARATACQRAAWRALEASVAEAWARLATQPALPDAVVRDVRLAAVEAARLAVASVDGLAAVAGMSLLSRDDAFSRAWRDVHGVTQHTLISVARERELGAGLLKAAED